MQTISTIPPAFFEAKNRVKVWDKAPDDAKDGVFIGQTVAAWRPDRRCTCYTRRVRTRQKYNPSGSSAYPFTRSGTVLTVADLVGAVLRSSSNDLRPPFAYSLHQLAEDYAAGGKGQASDTAFERALNVLYFPFSETPPTSVPVCLKVLNLPKWIESSDERGTSLT